MHYYTYAYLREDRTPYYIGKGKEDRIYSTNKRIKPPKDKSRIIFLKQNLTEEEAFRHEIYMIAVFGRKDLGTGILHNRTDGGEGTSNPSDETRKKMSEAKKGRTVSEETRRKIGEGQKDKIVSEETKRKMSEASKGNTAWLGKTHSEETRKKLSELNKGHTVSEETRKKLSEANKDPSEETKRKIGKAHKGTKWWNDGCGNRKRMIECPGDGWGPGMK